MLSKKLFSLYSSEIMVLFALKKETINLTSRIPWCMDYSIHQGMLWTTGGMHRVDGMIWIIFFGVRNT